MSNDSVSIVTEEPWNDLLETYMRQLSRKARNRAHQHESAGYHFKALNTRWGLPLILIPVLMSPISLLLENETPNSEYLNAGAFLLSGLVAGVYSYFRYGEKMERHLGFAGRYSDIITDIDAILVRGRAFREPADVCSLKMKMLMDNLALTEPLLPHFVLAMVLPPESTSICPAATLDLVQV